MKQVESDDMLTERDFGIHAEISARGGVLADEVGIYIYITGNHAAGIFSALCVDVC